MGYQCDNGDGNDAVILMTALYNGDVEAYCGPCLPAVIRAMDEALNPAPEPEPPTRADRARKAKGSSPEGGDGSADYDPGRTVATITETAPRDPDDGVFIARDDADDLAEFRRELVPDPSPDADAQAPE